MSSISARIVLAASALWLCAVSGVPQAAAPQEASEKALATMAQTVKQYCATCHNAKASSSATATGVILDNADLSQVPAQAEMWEKVVRRLRTGSMPPPGMPRPDAAASHALVDHLEGVLDRAAATRPNPGRHPLHRLNRSEYANAIRDLLGLDVDTSTLLPPDDSADGFDNNASLLGVSPALLERYLSAAAYISELAMGSPRIMAGSETYRVRGDASQVEQNEELSPGTRGGLMATHTFPLDGEYVIKVRLLQTNLGSIRGLEFEHQLEITVDGERALLTPVGGPDDYVTSSENATDVVNSLDRRLQVRVRVKAGQRPVGAAFLRRPPVYGGNRLQPFLRTTLIATDHLGLPHVESMVVTGPFNAGGASGTPSRERVFVCNPPKGGYDGSTVGAHLQVGPEGRACAERIIRTLARARVPP